MIPLKPLPQPQQPLAGALSPTQPYAQYFQALDQALRLLIAAPPNVQTANYILQAFDAAGVVQMNVVGGNTLTVPADNTLSFAIGTTIRVMQTGAGQTVLTAAGGVTIHTRVGLKIIGQWGVAFLYKTAANTWIAWGDLSA